MKRAILILVGGLLVLCGGCVLWWNIHSIPRRAYERLLAGDRNVEIKSLILTREGKRIVVDDHDVARYLTEAFRSSQRTGELFASVWNHDPKRGVIYEAELHLSSGIARCSIFFPSEGGPLSLSEPIDPHYMNDPHLLFLVRLPEPVPETLVTLLAQLQP